jgi:hypothetical protein
LAAAIDKLCDERGVPAGESRRLILRMAGDRLRSQVEKGVFNSQVLTLEKLGAGVLGRAHDFVGKNFDAALGLMGRDGEKLPATPAEKMRLIGLGIGGDSTRSLFRAAWEIDAIREAQGGTGEISREAVWSALFGENLPASCSEAEFGAALDARVDLEFDNLVKDSGHKQETIDGGLCAMSWEKLKSRAMRPAAISLADAPNVKSMISHQGSYEHARRSLNTDLCRRGKYQDKALPPPVFAFNFGDGQEKRITVGPNPDFQFINEADKDAYQKVKDNSMSSKLEEYSKTICGGEDANRTQVANVMLCLGQCTLIMLRRLAPLAGADLGPYAEHANVSVTLTRLENGAVRAEFSTPPEMREKSGSFSMQLDILPDGDIDVKSFNVTPPVQADA